MSKHTTVGNVFPAPDADERLLLALLLIFYEIDTGGNDDEAASLLCTLLDFMGENNLLYWTACELAAHGYDDGENGRLEGLEPD